MCSHVSHMYCSNFTRLPTCDDKRNVPVNCILLLSCWFDKSTICVRWGSSFSYFVILETGVRQGSILSPKLFALFVDELLVRLRRSGLGCHIKGMCFNAVMYADDLLLLSISISHLQKMIDICLEVLRSCFLDINPSKSVGLRIGPRHKFKCTLFVNGQPLAWKSELKYLGIFIVSSITNLNAIFSLLDKNSFKQQMAFLEKLGYELRTT